MRAPPADLADETLGAALREQYRLDLATLRFLPLGHDASAWVYRADCTDGRAFFVKVRRSIANEAGLLVPRYLHERGIGQVVAPVPTVAGRLWGAVGHYAVIVYPYIAGETGMAQRLTARQWREYGALLGQIHRVPVSAELSRHLRRDSFVPDGAAMVRRLDERIGSRHFETPAAQGLATFWQSHRDTIRLLVARAERLGQRLALEAPPMVLCHADIHTGNLIADENGELRIVDWDETLLAPAERDLIFAVGGISAALVSPEEEAQFLAGYGTRPIEPRALAYYRYAWAVADIGSFGEQVFFRPDLSEAAHLEGLALLQQLFAPGEIVTIALGSRLA